MMKKQIVGFVMMGALMAAGAVPPLMTTFDGRTVKTVADWQERRTEIKEKFLSEVYGRRPAAAAEKPEVRFECAEPDKVMMDGRALRKRVRCVYRGPFGESNFVFTAFVPCGVTRAPAFVLICNRDPVKNIDPERNEKSDFWPAEMIVERGYAAIAFYNGDVALDSNAAFGRGVFRVYERQEDRTEESWGVLSAWAWGASRVMDWIETEPTLDAKHVGVVGHSRGGKTALLTGVLDERFAMACSNNSGCGGMKLNHLDLPKSESIASIVKKFPFWFCSRFASYRGREFDMDFDQQMLAALIAPRLLAVASATEDHWAGQEGEFAAARLASPAWELYGRRGLVGDSFPAAECPLQDGSVSYHLRTGVHNLTVYDWARYLDFADRHNWRGAAKP